MTEKTISTHVDILGKTYPVRCLESELKSLQQAAAFLDQQMTEIQNSGKVINLERIAIISALNITHQFLQLTQQKNTLVDKVNQRIVELQEKLDTAIKKKSQAEFIYTTE